MQNYSGIDASRAYLYILLEALKTNRILIEIERGVLESLKSTPSTATPVPQKYIDYVNRLIRDGQGTIESGAFLDGLALRQSDADAVASRDDVAADIHYMSVMAKTGIIKFRDLDIEKKGQKVQDKDKIISSIVHLYELHLMPVRAFIDQAGIMIQAGIISRYVSIIAHVNTQATGFIEALDREIDYAQNAMKFATILPIREPVDKAMGAMGGLKFKIQDVITRLGEMSAAKSTISKEFYGSMLRTIDPAVQASKDKFQVFAPECAEPFKAYPGATFEATYTALQRSIEQAPVQNKDLIQELLLYFIESGQFNTEIKQSGKEKKELRKLVNQRIRDELISHVKATWPEKMRDFYKELEGEDRLSAILPKILKHALEIEERDIMTYSAENDLAKGQERLNEINAAYRERLKDIATWCDAMQKLLVGEYVTAMIPLKESLEHQEPEIARFYTRLEFFFHETSSQEEKIKIRDEVKKILGNLDVMINEFETLIGKILNQTYLDLASLGESIQSFKGKYQALLDQLNSTLNRYDAFKLMTIIEEIKQFIEKRNEKINLINNMILVDLRENVKKIVRVMGDISGMLKEGKGFSVERGKLGDEHFDATVADITTSLDGAISEEIIEDEAIIKKQLSLIEERLSELDTIKKNLEDKKDKLIFRLLKDEDKPKYLEEHKVGECIICYEPITTLDEEVIVCPHCGRIGHFLCLAYWLEKYSICPVCHGKLVRPEDSSGDYQDESYI
nr:RING finger protein [Candidatus Sigynarchaeota archaeon]